MKKGFTLIELLAVIVILAVIALIAVPIVLDIINETKESALIRSADFYIDALQNEIALENITLAGSFNPSYCDIDKEKANCEGLDYPIEIKVDGELPTSGRITFEEGKVTSVNLNYKNGTVTQNSEGKLVLDKNVEVVLAPGLYDENNNLIASWDELVEKHDIKNAIEYDDYEYENIVYEILENYNNESKLVIDESVTKIGAAAFSECTGLTSIIIPSSVTSIGSDAFARSGLTSITIPSSVTYIDYGAFLDCKNLTSITIPDSVISIEFETFLGCTNLTSITIPSGVTSIGSDAFARSGLTSITIPSSVTNIDSGAFEGCTNLTSIKVDENNTIYDSRDNSNAIIETETNTLIAGCKNTIIPSSVTSIGDYAFYSCTGLTSVTIPNSVIKIGKSTFYGCTGLTSIAIPDSVISMGSNVFLDCTSLTTIYYKGTATGAPWSAPNATVIPNF